MITIKFVICSKWDPRQPNVYKGVKLLEEILYMNKEEMSWTRAKLAEI